MTHQTDQSAFDWTPKEMWFVPDDLQTAAYVMERDEGVLIPGGKIPFTMRDDDDKIVSMVLLDPAIFEEFDLPGEITVTIEAGDTLNA